ncbi:MAG: PLDc N-terminal domain-containing protein [Cellvibrio sp.]
MLENSLILLLFLIIWLLPLIDIALSKKVSNQEKVIWIVLCIFVSWFAWIAYYLFAPVLKPK